MTEQERYESARKQVTELKGFYSHAVMYACAMVLLALIDVASGGRWWFYWPLAGWGVGLVGHATAVYGARWWGAGWEERKVRELMARDPGAR